MSVSFFPKSSLEPEYKICGECSGIPLCCVKFYSHYIMILPYMRQDSILKFVKSNTLKDFRYIPCEECIDKKPVKINKCSEEICTLPSILRIRKYMPTS